MNIIQGKHILILQQRAWGVHIGHGLARNLRREGAILGALTFRISTHEFTTRQKDVAYNFLQSHDQVMADPAAYLAGEEIPLARICAELKIDSVWPYVGALRNHVRSYRKKFYYSFDQNIPDAEIVMYVQALYKLIKNLFDTFKPDLIISPNFVSLPHIFLNLYARKHGTKMFGVTDSKVRGYNLFTYSFYENEGSFYDRVDELNNGDETNKRLPAKQYIADFRAKFKRPVNMDVFLNKTKNFKLQIRAELAPWYNIIKWYIDKPTNYLPNIGPTIDCRPPRFILRDHFVFKRNRRAATRFNYHSLADIKKFVYFPLQFQPESSIDVMAPFFNNQIETARLVAQSLPGDYTLVVKEHPAMIGYRAKSNYQKLTNTVNVKLVDYRIPSEKILSRADLVVSPNSTTIAEAAFLKIPAIQLGNLGTTLKLPNVFKHTDLTTLAAKIKEVINIYLESAEYETRLENFVAAAMEKGFKIDYQNHWEGKGNNSDALWEIYKQEIITALERQSTYAA